MSLVESVFGRMVEVSDVPARGRVAIVAVTITASLIAILYLGSKPAATANDSERILSLMMGIVSGFVVLSFFAIAPAIAFAFIARLIAVLFFFSVFVLLGLSIFFEHLVDLVGFDVTKDVRIFLTVSTAGMLGGMMSTFSSKDIIKNQVLSLWEMVHGSIVGLFVSVVLFCVLRAGIIQQANIDTFNFWGVAGVSAITGFFSENMIVRFSALFKEMVGERRPHEVD